jgi:transposase
MQVATIGLDLAKHVFQVHGVDAAGSVVVRKRLKRSEMATFFASVRPCLVGMEACSTSHYWAREIARFGHTVRLMPPAYVKPYVKRGKNDAADAEAICEAVTRPNMRFVAAKTADQQAALLLHRARRLLVQRRTMAACAVRSHLAEFGRAGAVHPIRSAVGRARQTGALRHRSGPRRGTERSQAKHQKAISNPASSRRCLCARRTCRYHGTGS